MKRKGHEWSKEQSEEVKKPNYSKLYIVQPALLELIGDLKDKVIAELGSGSGYWLKLLKEKGAKECRGVEISENQIELARRENSAEDIQYELADATGQTPLPANYFDVVLIEHVILELSEKSKIRGLFNEAYRILKSGGVLVFSDIHPFAPYSNLPNIESEEEYEYFESGHPFNAISTKPDGSRVRYTDFHWTLVDIWDGITEAGFTVLNMLEPHPSPDLVSKYPYLSYREKKPLSFMIKAKK